MNIYNNFFLSKDNHLRYWYNSDSEQLYRKSKFDVFNMSLTVSLDRSINFMNTLVTTAKCVYHQSPNVIFFFSGGLDSELALLAFKKAGIPITPTIIRFSRDYNIEDVNSACDACDKYKIKPNIIDFDPIKFFEKGDWRRIAADYQSYTFYQQILIYFAEQHREPILTVDEIELVKYHDNRWFFIKKEDQDVCWHRFVQKNNRPSYNNFYTFNPCTIGSFFTSATVQNLIKNNIFGKLGWSSSKNEIYSELSGEKMQRRPKRHGMEKMMNIWRHVEKETKFFLPTIKPRVAQFDAALIMSGEKKDMICNIA
jgi:hypothetical protein